MDFKKEFFQRKIKQETENEPYSSPSESFSTSNNLQIKFEDSTYTNIEPEDELETTLKAIVDGDQTDEPHQLKVSLTKNLDVELINNQQICRLCAQPITSTEIFLYEDGDLEQKINYTLPITMGLGDGLPEYICRNCEINLNMFYEFVCQVVNADKAIRHRINPPEFKTNSVTNAVIKEIFGTDEELEEENITEKVLQDGRLLKEQTNQDCLVQNAQLFEQETNEGYRLEGEQLFEQETINENTLQDGRLLKEQTNQDCLVQNAQLFKQGTNESYSLEEEQLFIEETHEGGLQDGRMLEEDSKKHLPDIKITEKRPNKDDNNFRAHKIQKISFLNSKPKVVSVEQYKCRLCKAIFSDYFALADHNKDIHEKIRYSCPEIDCSQIFTTQKTLRQHIIENHNVPVICCKCGKIFAHQAALDKHQDNFHTVKACDHCGMSFTSSISFETHRLLHEEVSEFQCVYCYKNFKNRHKLLRHTRQRHSGNFTLLVDMKEDEAKKNG